MAFYSRRIVIRYVIEFVCLFTSLQLLGTAMTSPLDARATSLHYDVDYDVISAPSCGGDLIASFTATPIEIPQLKFNDPPIYCEWTIRAPHPSLRIGLATVQILIDKNNFPNAFDVYDGSSADDASLIYFHSWADFELTLVVTKTSSSGTVFVNYTATGGPEMLQFQLLYFVCGGVIENKMEVRSPGFNATDTLDVPVILQCVWVLRKPQNSIYGYLHIHTISSPFCDGISVETSNGSLVAFEKSGDDVTPTNVTSQALDEFARARLDFRQRVYSEAPSDHLAAANATVATASNSTSGNSHQMFLCNPEVQGIAFSGDSATLRYAIIYPEPKYGFSAAFVPVRMPRKHPVAETPWYHNYAPVALYLPLGLVIGVVIIIVQGRRRRIPAAVVKLDPESNGLSSNSQADEECACMSKFAPKSILKSRDKTITNEKRENGVTAGECSRPRASTGDIEDTSNCGLETTSNNNLSFNYSSGVVMLEVHKSPKHLKKQLSTIEESDQFLGENRNDESANHDAQPSASQNKQRDDGLSNNPNASQGKKVSFRTFAV